MSNPSLRPPGESPPVPSPPRISSVTQGSTDHWRVLVLFRVFRREPVAQVVNTIFSRFTDAQISAVLLPLLKSRPEALRQRVGRTQLRWPLVSTSEPVESVTVETRLERGKSVHSIIACIECILSIASNNSTILWISHRTLY